MKKVLVFGILSLLITPLSTKANPVDVTQPIAQTGFERPQKPHYPHTDVKQRLNLSEEQKELARELRLNSQEKIKPIADEMKLKQNKKMELTNQDGDLQEIEQLGLEIRKLKQQIHGIIIQNERDFIQILTPEQKTEFNKIKQEGRREFHGRHVK